MDTRSKPNRLFPLIMEPNNPYTRELRGFWLFNETSGPYVYDYSPWGNHGMLTSMNAVTSWVPTPYGRGLESAGSPEHVDLGTGSELLGLVGDLSFILRVNLVSFTTGFATFFSGGSNNGFNWIIRVRDDGRLSLDHDAGPSADSLGTITTGTWYDLAWVHRASDGNVDMYIDGVYDSSDTTDLSAGATGSSSMFRRGESDSFYANAIFEYARLYARILTPTEIASIGNNPYIGLQQRRRVFVESVAGGAGFPPNSLALTGVGR